MTATDADAITHLAAPPFVLLSRVAEAAYWAGRYLERAEATARLVRCHTDLYLDLPRSAGLTWSPLLAVLGTSTAFDGAGRPPSEDEVVAFLTHDRTGQSSISASLGAVHENLRVTRPLLPTEAAEVLNELHTHVRTTAARAVPRAGRIEWLTGVIRRCQTLNGLLIDTMSHDDCFSFFTIGRQLERADMTTRILDVQSEVLMGRARAEVAPHAEVCWASALKSLNAFDSYRRRHSGTRAVDTLHFLLRDAQCPRSVDACLTEVARRMLELPRHEEAMAASAAVGDLLRRAEVDVLVDAGLHDFVDTVQRSLDDVHSAIGATWFGADATPVAA